MPCTKDNNEHSSVESFVTEVPDGPTANEIIKQLVKSLRDPTSSRLVHRNVCFLKQYIVTSNERTMIKDLPYLSIVLHYICCLEDDDDEFKGPMFHLLHMLSKPPHFQKTCDCVESDVILRNYFDCLGGLVVKLTGEPFIQKCIFNIIHNLLVREAPESKSVVRVELCIKRLAESNLCKQLSKLVSLNVNYNLIEALHTIIEMQILSDQCCFHFLNHNLHNYLLLYLEVTNEYRNCDLNNLIVRILSLLLEAIQKHPDQTNRKIKPPSIRGIRHLVNLLKDEKCIKNRTRASKQFRNDIASIILQSVNLFPSIDVIQFNILDDLVSLVIMLMPENQLKGMEPTSFVRSDPENFDFVKTIIIIICITIMNSTKYEIIQKKTEPVMNILLEFLVPWNSIFTIMWDEHQVKEFLNMSLTVIPLLLNVHAKQFVLQNGINRMMNLLKLFKYDTIGIDLFQRVAKSFNRTYDFYNKQSITNVEYKNLLRSMQDYVELTLLADLCKRILYTNGMSLAYQQILTHLLCTLQLMIEKKCYAIRVPETGISSVEELVYSCLDRITSPKEDDSFISNRLQVIIADFVWSFVNYSSDTCRKFIQSDGIYKVLDALQNCLFPIKNIYLSILVDLSENIMSIPYFMTWRGCLNNKKIGLINLLCELWRMQECFDKVKRDVDGCMTDTEAPLMGAYQFQLYVEMEDLESSPSLLNMLGNVCPKIYAILHLLEECHKDTTEIVEEQYSLSLEMEASPHDKVTLLIIRNYYKLKCGEIWQELDGDYMYNLPRDNLTPMYRDIIHTFAIKHINLAHHIQATQKTIIKTYNEKIEKENEEFFIIHNDSQFAPSMKALREICFNARIENLTFLTQAKEELQRQINNCRVTENVQNTIPTYLENLRLTTMSAAREKILMKKLNHRTLSRDSNSKESMVSPPSNTSNLAYIDQFLRYSFKQSVKRESLCKEKKRESQQSEVQTDINFNT